MSNANLTARMSDYFNRQIACCEDALAEYRNLPDDLTGPDLNAAEQRQKQYARRWQELADEFWALKREWDAAPGLTDADRDAVRELAGRAGPLADRLAAMQAAAADLLGHRMRDLAQAQQDLKQGRGMLRKYRAGDDTDARFMDKNA